MRGHVCVEYKDGCLSVFLFVTHSLKDVHPFQPLLFLNGKLELWFGKQRSMLGLTYHSLAKRLNINTVYEKGVQIVPDMYSVVKYMQECVH